MSPTYYDNVFLLLPCRRHLELARQSTTEGAHEHSLVTEEKGRIKVPRKDRELRLSTSSSMGNRYGYSGMYVPQTSPRDSWLTSSVVPRGCDRQTCSTSVSIRITTSTLSAQQVCWNEQREIVVAPASMSSIKVCSSLHLMCLEAAYLSQQLAL